MFCFFFFFFFFFFVSPCLLRYGPQFVTPLVEIVGDAKQSSEMVCAAAELLCKLFQKSDERLVVEAKGLLFFFFLVGFLVLIGFPCSECGSRNAKSLCGSIKRFVA
jgi:hypothetical protein